MTDLNKYKIAMVDDDQIGAKILLAQLSKTFVNIDYYTSSKEFLSQYEEKHYDLVLLDVMIPEISGTQVLEKIRQNYSTFELPVIMLSVLDGADEIVHALKMGANDYMTKPAHIAIAEARIHTQLTLKKYHFQNLKEAELETLTSMIVTYNHEINNPLTIALGNIHPEVSSMSDQKLAKVIHSLERIAKIVKSIRELKDKSAIETANYSQDQKMYKLK